MGEDVPVISLAFSDYYVHKNLGALLQYGQGDCSVNFAEADWFERFRSVFGHVAAHRNDVVSEIRGHKDVLSRRKEQFMQGVAAILRENEAAVEQWRAAGGSANRISFFHSGGLGDAAWRKLPLNKPLLFYSSQEQGRRFFSTGLSTVESKWTWTLGHKAVMNFHTRSRAPTLFVRVDCACFHHPQSVVIEANGTVVFDGVCGNGGLDFSFDNPGAGKPVRLDFSFPEAVSPRELGLSRDGRVLALKLRSLTIRG
jgi:hypothetical protein